MSILYHSEGCIELWRLRTSEIELTSSSLLRSFPFRTLADMDNRGKLNIQEFHVAMGLIYRSESTSLGSTEQRCEKVDPFLLFPQVSTETRSLTSSPPSSCQPQLEISTPTSTSSRTSSRTTPTPVQPQETSSELPRTPSLEASTTVPSPTLERTEPSTSTTRIEEEPKPTKVPVVTSTELPFELERNQQQTTSQTSRGSSRTLRRFSTLESPPRTLARRRTRISTERWRIFVTEFDE